MVNNAGALISELTERRVCGRSRTSSVRYFSAGDTPDEVSGVHQPLHAKLSNHSWISHRNGLIQAPIAA
jgi:hypothetical protein